MNLYYGREGASYARVFYYIIITIFFAFMHT